MLNMEKLTIYKDKIKTTTHNHSLRMNGANILKYFLWGVLRWFSR